MFILPTISTILISISAIFVIIGWRLIMKNKKEEHKKVMTTAAISALLFFIFYLTKIVLYGDKHFDGPDAIQTYYYIFLIFHISLATIGAVFGVLTLVLAKTRKIGKHRKIGPITSFIWLVASVTGIFVYFLLYIIY